MTQTNQTGTLTTAADSVTLTLPRGQCDYVVSAGGTFGGGTVNIQHRVNSDQSYANYGSETLTANGAFGFYAIASGSYQIKLTGSTGGDVDFAVEPMRARE